MSNEHLERIQHLEHQVRRWKRIGVVFALLLICALVAGGTSVGLLLIRLPDQEGFMWPWTRERAAREDALRARQEAVKALRAVEADDRAAKEREKQAADEAAKKGP